jgi:hypothetical protein
MTSTLPQHHSVSVSSFLTPNAVTLHHALTPSLRSTYASEYVNWLNFTAMIVLHQIWGATAQGQQCNLLRRDMYRLDTAVTEFSVIPEYCSYRIEKKRVEWPRKWGSFPSGRGGWGKVLSSYQRLQTGHLQLSKSQGRYFFFVRLFPLITWQNNNTNRHSVLKHMVPIHFMFALSNGPQHPVSYGPI